MLNGIELANLLRQRSFSSICHVNTVATALTYLRQGGLLSRQYVENNPQRCFQTVQNSDEKDKHLNIFNDIFFDAENLWEKMSSSICFYGPVVFIYDVAVLEQFQEVYVSRLNPVYWNNGTIRENCFSTVNKLYSSLLTSLDNWPIDNHIILHEQSKLDFTALKKIIIYCPEYGLFKINSNNPYMSPLNDPYAASNDLQNECDKRNIVLTIKTLDAERWNKVIERPGQLGRFYGFRSRVPQ